MYLQVYGGPFDGSCWKKVDLGHGFEKLPMLVFLLKVSKCL